MTWNRSLKHTLTTSALGLALSGLAAGCHHCDTCAGKPKLFDKCATITPGALPQPNGWHANRIFDLQAAKAEQDDFVIYLHEWYEGGTQLGPYGQYHLIQIIGRLQHESWPTWVPVLIQTSASGELDETRRMLIVEALATAEIGDAETRVTVGYPRAEGLDGNETERIYLQSLQYQGAGQNGGLGRLGGASGYGGAGQGGRGFSGAGIGGSGGLSRP